MAGHGRMSTEATALEAREVTKRFGAVTALAGVSVLVERGSCTALVGESGSGKTTLLRLFNRMVDADEGTALVSGRDVATREPVALRRSLGYVEQEGGLLPHWTVLRNVALVPWLTRSAAAEEAARGALDLVGLPAGEYGDRWPRELSGGQRQRAALARALAGGADVLLLDEPFGALDAITRAEVQASFAALRARLPVTVLLVTHDLRVAFGLADQVVVLRAGLVEQAGAPQALRDRPVTSYVGELLAKAGVS
jgi:osmoprotectant transport system ATP-binding protein